MGMVDDRLYGMAEEVAFGLGLEVEDVELLGEGGRRILRVTIDREGGVAVDDCAAFSRDFGALLDVEGLIAGSYSLEVSSPGLDRPLKRPRDYRKAVGKLLRVVTREKVEGRSVVVGRLLTAGEDCINLSMEGGAEAEIFLDNIKRARLEIEL